MFSFTKEQKVLEIGSIKIGGQPGVYPTVTFAGFFFKGNPDFSSAEKNIKNMLDISNKTGIPCIPDFFIKKTEYINGILDFIEKYLPDDIPFSVDIIEPSVKIEVLKEAYNRSMLSRMIYNSIHVGVKKEEINVLSKYTPEMTIAVAFNPKDSSPDGRIEVLENGAHLIDKGLLKIIEDIGIEKILVDTAALAPGENSGSAIAAIPVVKEEYGLPVGCAIHNVVEKSSWLKEFIDRKTIVDAASNITIPIFGGDFLLYGPVELTDKVLPIIAWTDILVSEYTERYFGIQPIDNHPRRRFFG